jgi:hypothetical protein
VRYHLVRGAMDLVSDGFMFSWREEIRRDWARWCGRWGDMRRVVDGVERWL